MTQSECRSEEFADGRDAAFRRRQIVQPHFQETLALRVFFPRMCHQSVCVGESERNADLRKLSALSHLTSRQYSTWTGLRWLPIPRLRSRVWQGEGLEGEWGWCPARSSKPSSGLLRLLVCSIRTAFRQVRLRVIRISRKSVRFFIVAVRTAMRQDADGLLADGYR